MSRRPLPHPPDVAPYQPVSSADLYAGGPSSSGAGGSRFSPWAFPPTSSTLQAGTLLHKGFYDLLALIPGTPTASKLLGWGIPTTTVQTAPQGPVGMTAPGTTRYEDHLSPATPRAQPLPRKPRKITKDMISRPTGFVHMIHASDADQAEALLRRWGPDGMGKIGDPRWADPIKDQVRGRLQARAIAEVVGALQPSPSSPDLDGPRVLRVVNGMSTVSTSTGTATISSPAPGTPASPFGPAVGASKSPFIPPPVSPSSPPPAAQTVEGLPRGSTLRFGALVEHEAEGESENKDLPEIPAPSRKPIQPSLATLEKAVAARIYFENLYFSLLRHPPSRDQRRLAMEREMEQLGFSEVQKRELRERWRQNETEYLRERRRKVDVSAFAKLKTIGHGAFGVVSLVKEKHSGQLFAMKELRKTDMLRKGQEGHVRAERDVLKAAAMAATPNGSEWIVRLFYSFQDRDHLYLVLEFMGGGDLLNLLIERDVFEEDFTRFYVAEMVLAIESCHKHGFIHRDIKPDNFLFDPEGHIKLSDFGLATDLHWAHDTSYYEQQRRHLMRKHGIDLDEGLADGSKTRRMDPKEIERIMGGGEGQGGVFTWREKNRKKLAYSVCGTNSYMSPEVIRGHGYTFSCDWWSLGVIMFECLYGYPPFVSNSRHVTRQKILNWRQSLRFPSRPRVSHEGVSLMEALLCEPEDRLGSQASSSVSRPNSMILQARRSAFYPTSGPSGSVDGAEHIKAHPWFRGIDWENIRKYPAPFRPELRNPEDTRHFDPDIPAEPLAPANGAPADATRDPLLKDKVHGPQIMEVRKALAFAGFTHKSPRVISYTRADRALAPIEPSTDEGFDHRTPHHAHEEDEFRGRSPDRHSGTIGRGRAISM
ncbi:kinase-like protein [Auriculariales sp. MPI-PUGE-AT-0066]|nr:kinase-like protein [Auriculariales sp. MPI-PUGE-AT-0066]